MQEDGQQVLIQYAGTLENGHTFVNTWINGGPVEYVIGDTGFLPDFDRETRSLDRGERVVFTIPCERAYGPYDEENVIDVSRKDIPDAERLPVGGFIAMRLPMGEVRVKVLSVDEDTVTLDCNHELAGHDLTFEVEMVRTGDESAVELEQAASGCGCGCDKLKEQLSGDSCECHGHHH